MTAFEDLFKRRPKNSDDWKWVVVIHWDDDHESPLIGPFESQTHADRWMTVARRVFRDEGVRPPRIERKLLRTISAAEGWIKCTAERRAAKIRNAPYRFLDR